jgi:hypothetical protein
VSNARARPKTVALVAVETPIIPPPLHEIADPAVKASIQALQRMTDKLGEPAKKAAGHPTLRDQVIETKIALGTNTINHGLGRAPRFVYFCPLMKETVWWTWAWLRRTGDADRDSIVIDFELEGPGAIVITPLGPSHTFFPVLIRVE